MYWLKVGRDFYNLENITKIDYSVEDGKLVVNIYSCLHQQALKLTEQKAALFLDTVSQADGCWAFSYGEEDSQKIKALLCQAQKESRESTEASASTEEEEQTITEKTIIKEDISSKVKIKES
jgi:hypothetical protein